MSNQRIEIIIKEINYWKEHKLLPDVYCDFLLALYTQGENDVDGSVYNGEKRLSLTSILQFISQFILLLLSVIVINMQNINLLFQMLFLLLSFLGTLWLFKTLNKRQDILFHLSTVILLVHFFLITVFLGDQYLNIHFGSNIILIFNFICLSLSDHKFVLQLY